MRRFLDEVTRKAQLECLPGPGAYVSLTRNVKKTKSYPFTKTDQRQADDISDNPGPADYDPCAFLCKPKTKKCAPPFLINSRRFKTVKQSNKLG